MTVEVPRDVLHGYDVTDTLNAWFAAQPYGTAIAFPDDARFPANGVLFPTVGSRIYGNGAAKVHTDDGFGFEPTERNPWYFQNWPRKRVGVVCRSNYVDNFTVQGESPEPVFDPTYGAQHGFELVGTGNTLCDVTVLDVRGDAVYHAGHGTPCNNSIVWHLRAHRVARQGIAWSGDVTGSLVWEPYITDVGRSLFDLEPAGDHDIICDVTIHGGRSERVANNFVASLGQGQVDDVTVANHTTRRVNLAVVCRGDTRRTNWRIYGCTEEASIYASHAALMQFARVDGLLVWRNHQPFRADRNDNRVFDLADCTDTHVADSPWWNDWPLVDVDTRQRVGGQAPLGI